MIGVEALFDGPCRQLEGTPAHRHFQPLEVEDGETKWRAVQMNISGQDPLNPGRFRLEHLDRMKEYRLLVADLRDRNQTIPNGWPFDDEVPPGNIPGLNAFRTDLWSEANSADLFKYEMSAQFATGFAYELLPDFSEPPAPDDYDAECIDLAF